MKTVLILAAVAASLGALPAAAQPAAAPGAETLGGPAVPGVCLLSREAVFANAKVGLAATARLRELAQQAGAEIEADRKPLQADAQALQSQRATLKPAELRQKEQALAQRQQAIAQKAQARNRELELTREKALAQISDQAQSVIAAVYKARGCGLLFNRDVVMGGNMSGDLTADVVKGLDAKVSTITFDRATLPAQPAAAASR